jgi:UPF0755 protein
VQEEPTGELHGDGRAAEGRGAALDNVANDRPHDTLGIDASVLYALGEQKEGLTRRELDIDSPYNTRRYRGLPPGPIASPGRSSLEAALDPVDGPWLYYVLTDESGAHYFTDDYDDFLAASEDAQARGVF